MSHKNGLRITQNSDIDQEPGFYIQFKNKNGVLNSNLDLIIINSYLWNIIKSSDIFFNSDDIAPLYFIQTWKLIFNISLIVYSRKHQFVWM